MKVYQSICELIGNTPIVKLNKIEEKQNVKNNLYAKIEKLNPGGSIKDRIAYEMINDAYSSGKINKNTTLIEATSGNTGIGLAMICAYYNIKLIIIMPRGVTNERIEILKAYGAKVVLTKKRNGLNGAIKKALELEKRIKNSYYINQFSNESNVRSHYNSTVCEILKDMENNVDFVFIGMGSSGTITGVAERIKNEKLNIKIVGVEPSGCPYYSEGKKGKHKIPGIGTNFLPEIAKLKYIDDIVLVSNKEAKKWKEMLAKKEGVFVGYSSGAVLAAAIKYVEEKKMKNKNIVMIFPDGGERYTSIYK